MCELACDQTSDWIMVDSWEAIQPGYQPTAVVLDHIAQEINDVIGGIAPYEGAPRSEYKPAQVSFLSGSDLLQTMSVRFSIPPPPAPIALTGVTATGRMEHQRSGPHSR
jgi:nicotinic acid mononucleotide adenylyltransferase